MTDNDKFGSTYSAKKVPLDSVDPTAMMLYGMGGFGGPAGAGFQDEDGFDEELDGEPGAMREPLPRDTIEIQLLLGDRKS